MPMLEKSHSIWPGPMGRASSLPPPPSPLPSPSPPLHLSLSLGHPVLELAGEIVGLLPSGQVDPGFYGNHRYWDYFSLPTIKYSPLPVWTGDCHNPLSSPSSLTRSNSGRQQQRSQLLFYE